MTSQPAPLLYAELLSNIRQISLAVSLGSASDAFLTRVVVAADGENVELNHHGQSHTLRLPSKVAIGGAILPIQRPGASTLSWRLPLGQATNADASSTDSSTWTATDLKAGSQVACRQCHAIVVNRDVVKVWKDLPSENWAEMMEFWHCHKPDDHDHDHDGHHHHQDKANGDATTGQNAKADDTSLAARGYGASSVISAQQSVGFIDLTTLLFIEQDCSNITVSPYVACS